MSASDREVADIVTVRLRLAASGAKRPFTGMRPGDRRTFLWVGRCLSGPEADLEPGLCGRTEFVPAPSRLRVIFKRELVSMPRTAARLDCLAAAPLLNMVDPIEGLTLGIVDSGVPSLGSGRDLAPFPADVILKLTLEQPVGVLTAGGSNDAELGRIPPEGVRVLRFHADQAFRHAGRLTLPRLHGHAG